MMPGSLFNRWKRGIGLSIYAYILLAIAWSPLAAVNYLDESRVIPDWLRLTLALVSLAATVVFCPLAFEWLTRKLGITMADRGAGHSEGTLAGPRVAATLTGDGKKKCGGCGAIVNVYAVRCHECKAVFVENGGVDRA
jgi:hypothetical protein